MQEEWEKLENKVKATVEGTERERGEEKKGEDSGIRKYVAKESGR